MLVFTITNNITEDVWVGTCKDSSDERFEQFQEAMALGIKSQFYKDLRDFSVQNFTVEDFAVAEDREELKDLFTEAMETYNGRTLVGIKTSLGKTSIAAMAPLKSSVKIPKRPVSSAALAISKAASTKPKRTPTKAVIEKVSSGRTGNAAKERLIKEKLADEKAQRAQLKSRQVMDQADEMAAIMARLDSRGSTAGKKR